MDMEKGQDIYLKNVTQIGTPGRGGKIYIADEAYARVHMDEFRDMRVFVLMGHTECSSGKYTTFIERVIPVEDISFIRSTPVWTNKVWSRVYQEIKRTCESMIIVGWALDQKGIFPKVNHELESVHREHFGGTNQVLFLLDTEAQEEVFYLSKNNHLYAKDGFYIYYGVRRKKEQQPELSLELSAEMHANPNQVREIAMESRDFSRKVREEDIYTDAEDAWDMKASSDKTPATAREQYRKMMESGYGHGRRSRHGNNAAAAVIALLLIAGIAWTALEKNPENAAKLNEFIETISNGVPGNTNEEQKNADYVIHFSTESDDVTEQPGSQENDSGESQENLSEEQEVPTDAETETDALSASKDVIPVEEVDGGIAE